MNITQTSLSGEIYNGTSLESSLRRRVWGGGGSDPLATMEVGRPAFKTLNFRPKAFEIRSLLESRKLRARDRAEEFKFDRFMKCSNKKIAVYGEEGRIGGGGNKNLPDSCSVVSWKSPNSPVSC